LDFAGSAVGGLEGGVGGVEVEIWSGLGQLCLFRDWEREVFLLEAPAILWTWSATRPEYRTGSIRPV